MRVGNISTRIAAIGPYTIVTRMTRNTSHIRIDVLSIVFSSAFAESPAAATAAPTSFLNAATAAALSLSKVWPSGPSFAAGAVYSLSPMMIFAGEPAAALWFRYGTYACASVRLAMSHEVRKSISRAIGLPWNEQLPASDTTVTWAFSCAATSAGLAAFRMAGNTVK